MSTNPPGARGLQIRTVRQENHVRASVRDEGGGLPGEIEQLFKPFYTTKPQGLGMGLAICRSIMAAHHGRLWADPNCERGAVFHFEIPLAEDSTSS
jgi:signal transduction histidine kinase